MGDVCRDGSGVLPLDLVEGVMTTRQQMVRRWNRETLRLDPEAGARRTGV